MMKRLGLIINPIAGMGGSVGLKGTDGLSTYKKAIELGAKKRASKKAEVTLKYIKDNIGAIEVLTFSGEMGESVCKKIGLKPIIIGRPDFSTTTHFDTEEAAKKMISEEVDLIIFAGGDGTARNIYNSVGEKALVVGIPAGVKIHSAVYGTNPLNAGKIIVDYYNNKNIEVRKSEVMDIDEEQFRKGKVVTKLYGYMKVPYEQAYVQSLKAGSINSDAIALKGMADYIIENMEDEFLYIFGPGTTTEAIMESMKLNNTLLGVDIVKSGKLLLKDANEAEILEIIRDKKTRIIITPIGGQGYIFGRGNQQISPRVINQVGKENIMIVSTINKLIDLKGKPFLVDTGDDQTDDLLRGYYKVTVGYDETFVYKCSY